ncbi:helix-turn-helix transcriptional regulator [Roseicitreum antarcticum]|uniref:DNA-binding transcriptional regulator, CsgD family n=1 Tax=Roseicitreum antarcticum TaxID=564137 RepID=A0A1H3A3R3_9RHOB|nr:hypothetical protein [Roseicitreum antarcticum]SDX24265.1 DNA-binding transcriptional regulator, CsgD family [Roseicitreum antarcticum]
MAAAGDTALIVALYQAASGGTGWEAFLAGLRAQARAGVAALAFDAIPAGEDGGGGPAQVWASADNLLGIAPAEGALSGLFDPDGPLLSVPLRPGRSYDLGEILPLDGRASQSLRGALEAQNIRFMRMIRIQAGSVGGGASRVWLAIGRGARDFDAVHSVMLSGLTPHLEAAVPMFHAARAARLRAAWGAQAFGACGLGWVLFGPRGQVADMDAGARTVLAAVPGVEMQCGARPTCADPGLAQTLAGALQRAAQGPGNVVPVRLCDSPAAEILLQAAPRIGLTTEPIDTDPPHVGDVPSGAGPLVLGTLRGPPQSLPDASALLCDMFGLTRAEARMTQALVQGASIAGAAAALGVTQETARSYTKQIYAKLGVAGQGGLIGAVLRSAAGLRLGA